MVHETCKEMLAIHALSAVDATERRELQAHLDSCETCRLELAEWKRPHSAGACRLVPRNHRQVYANDLRTSDMRHDKDLFLRNSQPAKVLPLTRTRSAPYRWPLFGAVAAARFCFLGLILGLVGLWRQNRAARMELARLFRSCKSARALAHMQQDTRCTQVSRSPHDRVKGRRTRPRHTRW